MHRLHLCEPLRVHMLWLELADVCAKIHNGVLGDESLRPLLCCGWPPVEVPWKPIEIGFAEGELDGQHQGEAFGDGSGKHQDVKELRTAAWGLCRLRKHEGTGGGQKDLTSRGVVEGWFPTVPRAELTALIWHLRTALIPSQYIGDCAYVIKGASGAPAEWLQQSRSFNADLWKEVAHLIRDHGGHTEMFKTKAHQARSAAENDDTQPFRWWLGNELADRTAKQLYRDRAAGGYDIDQLAENRAQYASVLCRVAHAVAWTFKIWPGGFKSVVRRRKFANAFEGGKCGDHVLTKRSVGCWGCKHCTLRCNGRRGLVALRRKPCFGDAVARAHPSHKLRCHNGILWCCRCGAHTTRIPQELLRSCAKGPRSPA